MSRIMNFDIDEVTEKRLAEIAETTGIKNNAGTIRYLINTTWLQMFGVPSIPNAPDMDNESLIQ
jgi:hypothetical protein